MKYRVATKKLFDDAEDDSYTEVDLVYRSKGYAWVEYEVMGEKVRSIIPGEWVSMPALHCSSCGRHEYDTEWMVEVEVITAPGEEGHAEVIQWLCDDDNCLTRVTDALIELGFSDHHHGGINFLEDPCVQNPYENCPTPSYGRHHPKNEWLNEEGP